MTPRVLLVATGDSMAYSTGPRGPGFARGGELLDGLFPGTVTADVAVEDVLAEPSWDTSPATMLALARRARSALTEDGFAGVVVTHGLDTIEETAFLTDIVLGDAARHGAVVFTGAAHHRDAPGADGPSNLAAAIAAAADTALRGAGAVICFDGELHSARWGTLVDAHAPCRIRSDPHPILGRVADGKATIIASPPPRPPGLHGEPETDVALIKTYPGMSSALLTTVVDEGSRGLVLEGTGPGNIPAELFTTIHELTRWDIPVVVASRAHTPGDHLDKLAAPDGLAAAVGAIGARGLPATKARYALMAALTAGGLKECHDWFAGL